MVKRSKNRTSSLWGIEIPAGGRLVAALSGALLLPAAAGAVEICSGQNWTIQSDTFGLNDDISCSVTHHIDFGPTVNLTDNAHVSLHATTVDFNQVVKVAAGASLRVSWHVGALNDTGVGWAGDYGTGNSATCGNLGSIPASAEQDCHYGRDATASSNADGAGGFSFTKLDSAGNNLPPGAGSWACVLDNVTGLVWEVKADDNGLHDKDLQYRWGGATAEGNFGQQYADWDALVNGSNNANLCGFSDWRLPQANELENLVHHDRLDPSIDTTYFPNTMAGDYWTASPDAANPDNAWYVYFGYGYADVTRRSVPRYVRLVRGAH